MDYEWGIWVCEDAKNATAGSQRERQLFHELPTKRIDQRFALQPLSSWKLPEAAMSLRCWALAEQELAISDNNGRHDIDTRQRATPTCRAVGDVVFFRRCG